MCSAPGTACRATAERAPSAPMTARARTLTDAPTSPGARMVVDDRRRRRHRARGARRCRCAARRRRAAARSRSHSSNASRSTMPTKPPSIGMSTLRSAGETMRAEVTRATSSASGIAKSRISRGGIAPPQGLMRPARSSSSTERPWRARSSAAVAPAGPPPTTTDIERLEIAPCVVTSGRCRRRTRRRKRNPRGFARRADGSHLRTPSRPPQERAGLEDEHRRIGHDRRCRAASARGRRRRARARPPSPKAMACAAPHRPMRTPSRDSLPSPARLIIEPMAAIENAPLATPSTNTEGRSGHAGPTKPATARPSSAAPKQGSRRPSRRAASRDRGRRTRCPLQPPASCRAARRRAARRRASSTRPGVKPNTGRRRARGSGPARCRPASRRRRRR